MADFNRYLDSTHFKYQNAAQSMFEDFKLHTGIAPDTSKDSTGKLKKDTSAADGAKPKWSKDERETLKKISQQIDAVLSQKVRKNSPPTRLKYASTSGTPCFPGNWDRKVKSSTKPGSTTIFSSKPP